MPTRRLGLRRMTFVTVGVAACVTLLVFAVQAEAPIQVSAKRVDAAPQIDGVAKDPCWKDVAPTLVQLAGVGDLRDKSIHCTLKVVHDGQSVYLLTAWDDATRDETHKDWVWSVEKKMYLESAKIEDMFSIGWEMKGNFTGNMLSPVEATWDVWQWGAARTNPVGFARDLYHAYSLKPLAVTIKPQVSGRTRDNRQVWIGRPEDAGVPPCQEVKLDSAKRRQKTQDVLKQFNPVKPSGSAGDVPAKGVWANGRWTLEFARKLNTGNKDDAIFTLGKATKMALSSFDHIEKGTHYASEVIVVQFNP